VTCGCGFLGSAIVRALAPESTRVRVLARPGESTENIDGLDVEIVRGDVLSIADVTRAVAGADTVYHAAAIYGSWMPDPTRMYDVNLGGTFNVMEACRRASVQRVVYTASIVSIGRPRAGELGSECTPYEAWDVDFAYSRSKLHSRHLAESFAEWGLDVRVVCPGLVLGPGDVAPTPSGKLLINTIKYGAGFYTDGGASYVDVRDAAHVHVLAARAGKRGERYVATAHNLTNLEFFEAVAEAVGRRSVFVRIPPRAAKAVVRAAARRAERRGTEPLLAPHMFEYSLKPAFYSNRKAITELGAQFRPFGETLRDAIAYFRGRGLF
jgi:dihydroflavonol-4-reductase